MLTGKHPNGSPKYYSGNGRTYLLDEDGFVVREVSEGEAEEVENMAWGELWDDFGVGLEDEEDY